MGHNLEVFKMVTHTSDSKDTPPSKSGRAPVS
jgi:hypothetical protein